MMQSLKLLKIFGISNNINRKNSEEIEINEFNE